MKRVDLSRAAEPPGADSALRLLGIPAGAPVPDRVRRRCETARQMYRRLAEPRGLYLEVPVSEFESLYRGEGLNARRTPLEQIFPLADRLALFAVTLGEAVSRRISELFADGEPALGYMLDTVASERADRAAEMAGRRFRRDLLEAGVVGPATRVLAYSPGYCGWHITGQRELFTRLRPQRIGIRLNSSCLMQPLKSVSGVLVAGPAGIHDFDDDFDFCELCSTHECRERISSIVEEIDGQGRFE